MQMLPSSSVSPFLVVHNTWERVKSGFFPLPPPPPPTPLWAAPAAPHILHVDKGKGGAAKHATALTAESAPKKFLS